MSINAPDALVGAIALEYVLLKFKPQLEEDPDFRGAFHVLSGFSAEQLVGFIQARMQPASGPHVFRSSSRSLSCADTALIRPTQRLIRRSMSAIASEMVR